MKILLSFAGLVPRILLGFWIIHFLWKSSGKNTFLIMIFLSAAVGFGSSSLMGFLWIWAGLPLAAYAILESIFAIALTIWMFYTDREGWKPFLHFSVLKNKTDLAWGSVLSAGIFLFALNLWMYALQNPHGRPDAWINWNVAARFIHLGGAHWQNTFFRQLDHPDYPLFLAVTNAITWVGTRTSSVWGPIAFHSVLSFFTAGLLFAFVNRFQGFKQATLAAILFISLPSTVDNGMRQYADLLLSYLVLAVGGLTLVYFTFQDNRMAILAGFIAGLAGWTKNEGLAAMVGFTIIWGVIALHKKDSAFRDFLIGLAVPLLIIVLFKLFLAPSNDLLANERGIFDKIMDIGRYRLILQDAGIALWNIGEAPINIIGFIIIYMALVGRTYKKLAGTRLIGIFILFQLSAYFVIYLITPYDLTWHLQTSLSRLSFHVLPLTLLLIFIWLKSPQELSSIAKKEI